jgi:hypothetical protein
VTSGPCTGFWYVASSTLKCQRETVINRYIKPGGPVLGPTNFYGANGDCFSTSVGDFIQAVKNHEYRGTPDTPKSPRGHQGRIEQSIIDSSNDAKLEIEALTSGSQNSLSAEVNDTISNCELQVFYYFTDEWYMQTLGPNWGGSNGLGTGENSRTNDEGSGWSDCVNDPQLF